MELNKIYNGNALNLLKHVSDNSIDMVMTSPPYDSMREYDGIVWNFEIFKLIAQDLKRVLKDGGVIVWVVLETSATKEHNGITKIVFTIIKWLLVFLQVFTHTILTAREREREWCLIHSLVVEQVALLQSI